MSKERDKFDLEEWLIEFAVRVIRTAESLPEKTKIRLHNSIPPGRDSTFDIKSAC